MKPKEYSNIKTGWWIILINKVCSYGFRGVEPPYNINVIQASHDSYNKIGFAVKMVSLCLPDYGQRRTFTNGHFSGPDIFALSRKKQADAFQLINKIEKQWMVKSINTGKMGSSAIRIATAEGILKQNSIKLNRYIR